MKNRSILLLLLLAWLDSWIFSLFNLKKKKKKKKPNLQIAIFEKIYRFLVFIRDMKESKLRRS